MKRRAVSPLVRVRYVVGEPTSSASSVRLSVAGAQPGEVDRQSVPESGSVQHVRIAARCDAPVLAPTTKGVKGKALEATGSGQAKESALAALHRDMDARSAVASRDSLLKAWLHFHVSFGHGQEGESVDPFPLTVLKVCAVWAMLKAGGYRSPANYLSRAKEERRWARRGRGTACAIRSAPNRAHFTQSWITVHSWMSCSRVYQLATICRSSPTLKGSRLTRTWWLNSSNMLLWYWGSPSRRLPGRTFSGATRCGFRGPNV